VTELKDDSRSSSVLETWLIETTDRYFLSIVICQSLLLMILGEFERLFRQVQAVEFNVA